jgi:quercetin dioxygenase-like cupin family protein
MKRSIHGASATLMCITLTLTAVQEVSGQICRPVSERTGELGCWIVVNADIGRLPPEEIYWHLDTYPTRLEADAAKGARGSVVAAFDKIWLLTIEVAAWRPLRGERVATIGPLPLQPDVAYSAQYMDAVFAPGMTAPAHTHSGPEAWYTLSGETCLETPDGKMIGRAGGSHVIVPGGPAMHLTATGTETRRALVLILHDSTKAPSTPMPDWKPKGLCTAK